MGQVSLDLAKESTSQEILNAVNTMTSNTGGVIKRVQRGVITFDPSNKTATATISAVDTSKAFVLWGGAINGAGSSDGFGYPGTWDARVDLTNATTVTATKWWAFASTISYQVVEFN